MTKTRKKEKGAARSLGWLVGAAAVGIGAGIAVERLVVGRSRLAQDPYAKEPYGRIRGDRRFEVKTPDGAVLVGDEVGPADAKSGVIFLHGFCLDRTIWHHQYREFPSNRKYVFYDARHHGQVTGGSLPTDTRVLAADLRAILDSSGLEEVVLVGHSMGGMTVLEFCREHPEETGRTGRIRGLILANTTYTDAVKTLFASEIITPIERRTRRIVDRWLESPRGSGLTRLRAEDLSWILVKLMGFGPKASPAQVEFVHTLLTCFPSPPLVETLRGIRAFDMEEALSKIDVPALIVAGGDDRITTVRASRKMAEEIPGSRLVVFEKAGHMTMLEKHEEFNRELAPFFDEFLSDRTRKQARGA